MTPAIRHPFHRLTRPALVLLALAWFVVWISGPATGQDGDPGATGATGGAASEGPTAADPDEWDPGQIPFASRPDDRADPPLPADTEGTIELDGNKVLHFYRCRHRDATILKKYVDRFVGGMWTHPYGARRNENVDITTMGNRRPTLVNSAAEILVIEAPREKLKLALAVLERLDVPRPQVLLDCRIIEVSYSRGFQLGFSLDLDRTGITNGFFQGFDLNYDPVALLESLGGSGAVGPKETTPPDFLGGNILFNNSTGDTSATTFGLSGLAIRALQQNGSAKILANPRLLVMEDQSARVTSGEDVFIQEIISPRPGVITIRNQPRNAGITLDIRPLVISESTVQLRLQPAVREITGFTTPGESGVSNPIIASRSADTLATVPSGKTLVIGGLIQTESRIETKGIPLLADLPLIGELFKNHNRTFSRTEVIFAITPYIIGDNGTNPYIPTATGGSAELRPQPLTSDDENR